jgi:ABC-type glycerol-3-phosphate transport system permease component
MDSIDRPSVGRIIAGWVIIALTVLFVILLIVVPLIRQYFLSFQEWKGLGEPRDAGSMNYTRLLEDASFPAVLKNTLLSPGLYFRAFLLVSTSLALALLLMELRNGGRVAVQVFIAFLILFSGALVTAFIYFIYYSPMDGLARSLTPSPDGGPVDFLGDPERAVGVLGNLLLAVGLAFALPLGTAMFLGAGRGARSLGDDSGFPIGGFWARTWRLVAAAGIGAIGFSLVSLEGAYAMPLPMRAGENLVTLAFRYALQFFNLGEGAAAIQFLIWPLLALGLACALLLETGRSRISIKFVPRLKERITAGAKWNAGRVLMIAAAGTLAIVLIVMLIVVVGLPWLGSIIAFTRPLGALPDRIMDQVWGSLGSSIGTALLFSILAWTFASLGGFAFGYLQPRGSRWLLVVLGIFLFIGPTVLVLPYFLIMKELGLLGSPLALVIPGLASPVGIFLYTWFFRGARDEKTAAVAGGFSAGRMWAQFFLFSIPLLAVFMLFSLSAVLLPITMLTEPKTFPMSLFLMQVRGEYMMPGLRSQAILVQLAYLQYVIPLALLIISVIVVFPRLALLVRKRGEAIPSGGGAAGEQTKTE